MIVLNAFIETIMFLSMAITIVLMLNYIFNKDFRNNLANKIKRVISSQQANKITQIQNIILDYFF